MTATQESKTKVVDGTVYGLFPESSRTFYEECIAGLAEERKVELSSNLNSKSSEREQVWKGIHTAEVVLADITGYDLQTIYRTGLARATKDAKKILLICSKERFENQKETLPQDLQELQIAPYDDENYAPIKQTLTAFLSESLRNRLPPNPIQDQEVRQLIERAMVLVESKDFLIVPPLFEAAEARIPDHWYIKMQQGVMYREKGDYQKASDYFKEAEKLADFDEYRAEVYIEQAILEFRDKKSTSKAEAFFDRAKNADKKSRRLYKAWAEVMDQAGFPESASGRISELVETVGRDDETILLMRYYSSKVGVSNYSLTFEEFRQREKGRPPHRPLSSPSPQRPGSQNKPPLRKSQKSTKAQKIPNNISWTEFEAEYRGTLVEGMVKNIHPKIGVFVYLGDFKGLIPHRFAPEGLSDGDRLEVEILKMYIRDDGKEGINLRFVSKLN